MLLIHVPYHDTFLNYFFSVLHEFMWSVSDFSWSVSTRLRKYFFSCHCDTILDIGECSTNNRSLIIYRAFPLGSEHFAILLTFPLGRLSISLPSELFYYELCFFLGCWNNCATFEATFFAFIMMLIELCAKFFYGVEVHYFIELKRFL